jgi:hypothetical protein
MVSGKLHQNGRKLKSFLKFLRLQHMNGLEVQLTKAEEPCLNRANGLVPRYNYEILLTFFLLMNNKSRSRYNYERFFLLYMNSETWSRYNYEILLAFLL